MTLEDLYSGNDLFTLFKGGYINFGYWKGIDFHTKLNEKKRIQSSQAMYEFVASKIKLTQFDQLLEVGCGHAAGLKFLFETYHPQSTQGVDILDIQLEVAKKRCAHITAPSFTLLKAEAENLPFQDQSITKIITIEAAQHFSSITKFLNESYRVLKNEGTLAICTFFSDSDDKLDTVLKLFPAPAVIPVQPENSLNEIMLNYHKVIDKILQAGFSRISIEPIGKEVWPGYDAWVAQSEDNWDRNFLKAYQEGLLNYYLILAYK